MYQCFLKSGITILVHTWVITNKIIDSEGKLKAAGTLIECTFDGAYLDIIDARYSVKDRNKQLSICGLRIENFIMKLCMTLPLKAACQFPQFARIIQAAKDIDGLGAVYV
ncbi:MAG TPA: hypothetical protein VKR32_06480 [Puia sp.]|nr:hypothetical protein [Puia sp.]